MTTRPARQEKPAKERSAPDERASRADAWVASAESRERGASKPARAAAAAPSEYKSLVAAAVASEQRAAETASRTATALGSVASWLERAQEQITETSRTSARAQDEVAAKVQEAVGSLGDRLSQVEQKFKTESGLVSDALQAIGRIETRLSEPAPQPVSAAMSGFEAGLRAFEGRLGELSERMTSAPRPIGRRGLTPEAEVRSAVEEIRSHQAQLDRGGAQAPRAPAMPTLGSLGRSQTALLSSMNAEIAKLSTRLDGEPAGSGELAREVDTLRHSIGDLPTRDDLARLERGIQALTTDMAGLRVGDVGTPVPRSTREIEALAKKIDGLAASGVDPKAVSALSRQMDEIRRMLAGASAPQALSLVSGHLDNLRREIAEVGERQVGTTAIASLQSAVDDIQHSIGSMKPAKTEPRRDGQTIEAVLGALVEKIDRVEQRVADPRALDGLQNQIEILAARMDQGRPSSDPAVAALERSVTGLLQEVMTWRSDTAGAAEAAVRAVLAETGGATPATHAIEAQLAGIQDRYEAAETRTADSLANVNAVLESVMRRMGHLEAGVQPMPGHAPASAWADADLGLPPSRSPPVEPAADARYASLDAGLAPPRIVDDELLLEPGSRPEGFAPPNPARSDGAPEVQPDIRSSFIAAARRAAQAAQAETAISRKAPGKTAAVSLPKPADVVARIRTAVDRRRRPALLSAAAVVLAIGSFQLVRDLGNGFGDASAPAEPIPSAFAPTPSESPAAIGSSAALDRSATPDPTATGSTAARAVLRPDGQGVAPARDETPATPPAAAPEAAKEAGKLSSAAPAAAPTKMAAASGAPAPVAAPQAPPVAMPPTLARPPVPSTDPAATLPANLRSAANAGNPEALYDLAARTADGRGVTRDPKAALALFEKAADKGLAPAQYRIGNMYEHGNGVPRDLEQAKTWYRRAATAGNVRAMHNLAVLLADTSGGKADYAGAVGWFTRAADHGVRDSQFNLAVLHARGLGTPADLYRSYVWLAIAAGRGDEDAARKRDEVALRLSGDELARAKTEAAAWRVVPPTPAANDVAVPAGGWPEAPVKRAATDSRRTF